MGEKRSGSRLSVYSLHSVHSLTHTLQKLIHAIFADYARSLKTLGFKQAATLFASKAGPAGKDLLNELEQLKEEE